MQPEKKKQRQIQLQRLSSLSATQKEKEEGRLYAQLFASQEWQTATKIATTMSGPVEVNTEKIIHQAWAEGKTVLLPQTLPHWQMAFHAYTTETHLEKSHFGVLEPTSGQVVAKPEIDLILVPGLAFTDQQNYRLGFGGGYYDRYLSDYKGQTISLVLSVQQFSQPTWPLESHDIPIKKLIKSGVRL
ncbi:5-formyltetrahydrofolate cyclo-ligase [Pediococcus siamensis]|uniref:5-formyltetrahydrofolate cyclo-ligase n=1 Tax=Pediococcus siamensis TaxID=381829 RepID=UPI0039A2DF72